MILHFIRQPGIEIVVRSADPRRQCLYGLIRLLDAPVGAVPNLSHKGTFKSHWLIHRIIGHQMQRSLGQMRPDFIQYILIPASSFAYVAEFCFKRAAALRNMGTEMGSAISRGFMRMASV